MQHAPSCRLIGHARPPIRGFLSATKKKRVHTRVITKLRVNRKEIRNEEEKEHVRVNAGSLNVRNGLLGCRVPGPKTFTAFE